MDESIIFSDWSGLQMIQFAISFTSKPVREDSSKEFLSFKQVGWEQWQFYHNCFTSSSHLYLEVRKTEHTQQLK